MRTNWKGKEKVRIPVASYYFDPKAPLYGVVDEKGEELTPNKVLENLIWNTEILHGEFGVPAGHYLLRDIIEGDSELQVKILERYNELVNRANPSREETVSEKLQLLIADFTNKSANMCGIDSWVIYDDLLRLCSVLSQIVENQEEAEDEDYGDE